MTFSSKRIIYSTRYGSESFLRFLRSELVNWKNAWFGMTPYIVCEPYYIQSNNPLVKTRFRRFFGLFRTEKSAKKDSKSYAAITWMIILEFSLRWSQLTFFKILGGCFYFWTFLKMSIFENWPYFLWKKSRDLPWSIVPNCINVLLWYIHRKPTAQLCGEFFQARFVLKVRTEKTPGWNETMYSLWFVSYSKNIPLVKARFRRFFGPFRTFSDRKKRQKRFEKLCSERLNDYFGI